MTQFNLYYNDDVFVEQFVFSESLQSYLDRANEGDFELQTNLVRLNWMIENLKTHPMYKPILVDQDMLVLNGMTRCFALEMCPHITTVSALMTTESNPGIGWHLIESIQHLADRLHLPAKRIKTEHDWHDKKLQWIEFGFDHTVNHMHDEEQKQKMMRNYLNKYPDVVFTKKWLSTPVEWNLYDE